MSFSKNSSLEEYRKIIDRRIQEVGINLVIQNARKTIRKNAFEALDSKSLLSYHFGHRVELEEARLAGENKSLETRKICRRFRHVTSVCVVVFNQVKSCVILKEIEELLI